MVITNWTKLVVCVLVLVAASLGLLTKTIDGEAGVGLIMGVLGYVFGNGHGIAETNAIVKDMRAMQTMNAPTPPTVTSKCPPTNTGEGG